MASTELPGSDRSPFEVEDWSRESRGGVAQYRCVDCLALSPPAESNFTLISARFGWRLHRERDLRSGEWVFEWRCPSCWEEFRAARLAVPRAAPRPPSPSSKPRG